VIYILQHDSQGAFGLVLNRPLNISVGELLRELTDTEVDNQQPVFYGGPVDGLVVIVQENMGETNEQKVVLLSKDRDQIAGIANHQSTDGCSIRIFDGYSGWGPSQLNSELEEGSWLIWDAQPEILFSDPDGLWQTAVRQIGRDVIAKSVAGMEMPIDPTHN